MFQVLTFTVLIKDMIKENQSRKMSVNAENILKTRTPKILIAETEELGLQCSGLSKRCRENSENNRP